VVRKHNLESYAAFDEVGEVTEPVDESGNYLLHEDRIDALISLAFNSGYVSLDKLSEVWEADTAVPAQYTIMYLRREYGGISGYLSKKNLVPLATCIYKLCPCCSRDLPLAEYTRDTRARHGYMRYCKSCGLRNNPPDKLAIVAGGEKRRSRIVGLPSNWNKKLASELLRGGNSVMDHFIPLSTGHCGTYVGNMVALSWQANNSKRAKNPFEWFPTKGMHFGITRLTFESLVGKLAHQNGLTPDEFKKFTYWCFENKRAVDEIKSDNIRYGYKKPSLEIWRESVGLHFPMRANFGALALDHIAS
jgi:hypothetical protein